MRLRPPAWVAFVDVAVAAFAVAAFALGVNKSANAVNARLNNPFCSVGCAGIFEEEGNADAGADAGAG